MTFFFTKVIIKLIVFCYLFTSMINFMKFIGEDIKNVNIKNARGKCFDYSRLV